MFKQQLIPTFPTKAERLQHSRGLAIEHKKEKYGALQSSKVEMSSLPYQEPSLVPPEDSHSTQTQALSYH